MVNLSLNESKTIAKIRGIRAKKSMSKERLLSYKIKIIKIIIRISDRKWK